MPEEKAGNKIKTSTRRRQPKFPSCAHCTGRVGEFQFSAHDRPTTARQFKQGIEQVISRALNAIVLASSFCNDINFLNELSLQLLDGVPPLADEREEKLRVLLAGAQEQLFERLGAEDSWNLADAVDEFMEDVRRDLRLQFQPGCSRWDRLEDVSIKALTRTISAKLEDEQAKEYLVVLAEFITKDAPQSARHVVDQLIQDLYMSSATGRKKGLYGFIEAARESVFELNELAETFQNANREVEKDDNKDDDDETVSDLNFFDENPVIGEGGGSHPPG